jgi:hypothetical protein
MENIDLVVLFILFAAIYWSERKELEKLKRKHEDFQAWNNKNHVQNQRYVQRLELALKKLDPQGVSLAEEAAEIEWSEAHKREDGIFDFSNPNIPKFPPLR